MKSQRYLLLELEQVQTELKSFGIRERALRMEEYKALEKKRLN